MAFLGTFEARLDEKNRMPIPAKYRDQFDAPAYLTSGEEPCIAVYTRDSFEARAAAVKANSADDEQGRDALRKFFGDAHDVARDAQGRLLIPQRLLLHAGLTKDVTVVGSGDWFEIWDAASWRTRNEGA
ncbi:MAG: division/cell wall cluster transcriptional repressor MraZ [Dehalococcoidia bacterium]